ncbi:Dam family site-specific DNA-(adenine-N6)-methyltransferase [Alteromonas oceanisediminis]|uniref:Dam family site-specific DNA-(adenine-N6)-methyltransferase n=1 Tax=Alteromonas oceanisediminis TaxID=2836180 RepID=UPI001BD92EAF|nr:Dam family site-specific DNA-(adenine-N6)-methyltransferase [Alteromonas oceanisediminis]MBT0586099.1 Dam family site-specific DNA-(adenine-N6)-methyltransferase [Alteromonas oceanisediminis]
MKTQKTRAFLKWAGGKYTLTEQITQILPDAEKLVEPFVGAGSVFLNSDYERYHLNDINPDLIALYTILKRRPQQYINDARRFFITQNNHESAYYALRERFNHSQDDYERALLFLYLNRHGYNGLCRYNRSGGFNVPFGRYVRPYFPERELEYFAAKAKKATFTCLPFNQIFKRVRKNAVIYCDPPYVPINTTAMFTDYSSNGFSLDQQVELARLATHASQNRGIPVLISNHDVDFTRNIYQHAEIRGLKVKRSISQNGATRVPVSELFAYFRGHATV